MVYRLAPGEGLASGLRRALVEELDAAAGLLRQVDDAGFDTAIHETRKALKRARTVVRLLRDTLGDERYRTANARLRDAGRALAGTRDAAVLLETLDGLDSTGSDAAMLEDLRGQLAREHAEARRRALERSGPRIAALEQITDGRADAARWSLEAASAEQVLRGVERIYRRGGKRLEQVEENPAAEALHEWRKRVKDLGYSLRLVEPVWPQMLEALAEEAQRLWNLLGDDHDLHLLVGVAESRLLPAGTLATLRRLADARRGALQREAFALGRRLYADPPGAFVDRIGRYLGAWRAEEDAPATVPSPAHEALGQRPA